MNTQARVRHRFSGCYPARITVLIVLLGVAPFAAAQEGATAVPSRVTDVSLTDLDLSTPEGMSAARERLDTMARRVCAARADHGPVANQPNVVACVDSTLAGALKQINALRQINMSARNSVTRAANVSLADLDLSTLEGFRAARERLEAMARRLCAELARSNLAYQPNYAACVQDSLAGALRQANAVAAAKETRTAQRLAP